MKTIFKKYGFTIYSFVAIVHLIAIVFEQEDVRFITKPLLMPLLALAVYGCSAAGRERTIIITAIFFSLLGDSFLLFDYLNPLYFIFGLISFLITHILYIVYFIGIKPLHTSLLKIYPWIIVLVVGYGVGLVYFLYPKLGDLKIPVIVYAVIICSMLLAAIHIFKRVKAIAGWLLVAGAVFFVVSDSLLAINKFHSAFSGAAFLIMFTYCAAQYCIAKGFTKAGNSI
ncbi:MAG: lysoplasmalogenase [Sphingobacteriales bacterium]|nr:MAG: lysoplasmalogenase [Sphingobacteriales bacterium]